MTYPTRGKPWFLFFFFLCQGFFLTAAPRPIVLVSVAPHKCFIEKIAKDTVDVQLMVPAGASSHTYEPTPKQMIMAGKADLWFRIGEPFETRAIQALTSHHPNLKVVDLRQELDLIQSDSKCCCSGSVDLHFWLSARQAQIQARLFGRYTHQSYPEHTDDYRSNYHAFIKDLQALDNNIQTLLAAKRRHVLVSHPAYAYFCRDYAFEQSSIEIEGKDPSPQQMTKLLNLARKLEFKKIFIQIHYQNKAAKLVAETLGAELLTLDPYSEHYFQTMIEIAHAFANE